MIENTTIDEIRSRADIVTVVSDYVALKKRGKNYLGLCPFHSEKTASFTVSQEKQLFHCFGCSEGGNVFSFIMKMEKVPFAESAKILADKLGITLKEGERASGRETSSNQKLTEILEFAVKFYEKQLPRSESAVAYITKRGLSKETLSAFRIGYSPESWDSLYRYLVIEGFLPKDIEKAGLIIPREGNTSYYDRFRNRLMIPIFDHKGKPIAFGARSLDGSEPKYINSPESPLYNKGSVLYGLDLSKEHIREQDSVLIMEGYMDVISAYSAGFRNVVASSGTALTAAHAKLLQRLTANFVLVFDSDAAGSQATERSISLLGDIAIYPKIAELSGGKDPDEIIRKEGPERFASLLGSAVPWLKYRIEKISGKYDLKEVEGKAKALKESAAVIAKEKDPVIRDGYIKLLSLMLNIDTESVSSEVKRLGYYGRSAPTGRREPINKPLSKLIKAEMALIKLAVEDPDSRRLITGELNSGDFADAGTRQIFEMIAALPPVIEGNVAPAIIDSLADEGAKKLFSSIMFDESELEDRDRALSDCINVIKMNKLKDRLDGLRTRIFEAEKKADTDTLSSLQGEYKKCHEEMRAF